MELNFADFEKQDVKFDIKELQKAYEFKFQRFSKARHQI